MPSKYPHTTARHHGKAVANSNTLMMIQLMESHPLMQAFVLEAVKRYADKVVEAGPNAVDTPFMSGKVWHGMASQAVAQLDAHLS